MTTQNSLNNTIGTVSQVYGATTNLPPSFQNAQVFTKTVVLTSSQVKNLHATPIEFIPAPSSGKIIFLLSCAISLEYGGTNAFTAGASQSINLYYGSTSGTPACQNPILTASSISATVNKTLFFWIIPTAAIASNLYETLNIIIYQDKATEVSGNAANNNTISITAFYQIVG